MPERQRSSGYTLIEVLVAFMILALALTVLLRIFSGGLRNVSLSSQYSRAVLIAETRLAAADTPDALTPGMTTGIDGDSFRWIRTVSEYAAGNPFSPTAVSVPAYRIDVTVEWDRGGRTRSIELTGLRLGPDAGTRL